MSWQPKREIRISFVPAVVPNEGGMDFVGRTTSAGTYAGARLRNNTRCAVCDGPFAKGDVVDLRLAADWDDAVFAHRSCGLPSPPEPINSAWRGFGLGVSPIRRNMTR